MINFASQAPLRVAFFGTSGHAVRNMLPSLPYLDVELVSLWDPDPERARHFARQFGAAEWFTDAERLIAQTSPEAVFIATGGRQGDELLHTYLARRCLELGCHVWTDKPIAETTSAVEELIMLSDRVGKIASVGAKALHNPAYVKAGEIVASPEFGRPTLYAGRYPLKLPPPGAAPTDAAARSCLGHLWHPIGAALAVLGSDAGEIVAIERRTSAAQGGVAIAEFAGGAVGSFAFTVGQSETSPLERVEVVGDETNLIIENGVQLTWYRRASLGPYGETMSYLTDNDSAPLTWMPELSLGQLYNNNNVFQGYAPSMAAFVDAVRSGTRLTRGTLADARRVLSVFELLLRA